MASAQSRYVLVIDDDASTRSALREVLEGAGYVVRSAADGAEAVSMLPQLARKSTVIVLDILMPDMDGFEFILRLREHEPSDERIPVVVLTGDPRAAAKATLLDVDAVLRKPLDGDELLDAISARFNRAPPALA